MCSFRTSLPEGEDNSNSDGGSLRKVIETDLIIVKVVTTIACARCSFFLLAS